MLAVIGAKWLGFRNRDGFARVAYVGLKSRLIERAAQSLLRYSAPAYLGLKYRRRFGRWPSFRRPRAFTEQMLLYKLSTRGDERLPRLADKVLAKDYVARLVGDKYVIPTLWHGTKFPPLDERTWPTPFVIKSTHGSMQYLFVRKGEKPDWSKIETITGGWLSRPYELGRKEFEWHYEHITPQLLVEPMLGDGRTLPPDFKLAVFSGRAKLIQVDEGRDQHLSRWLMDRDWMPLPFNIKYPRGPVEPERPTNLAEMIWVAETLARGFEFVRVDLYNIEGRIYFGEMTFFPGAGRTLFDPPEGDYAMGEFWRSAFES